MKICFLAPANNYHTQKWCEYFVSKNYEVYVISLIQADINNVKVYYINSNTNPGDSDLKKLKYLSTAKKIKKIISEIKPDIISAHYATSYGMLASLVCPNNFFLSIWGSDVYNFPQKSIIHKMYLKFVLNKAKYILSTSNAMSQEISKYTSKKIYVTPFGIKMDLFNPNKKNNNNSDEFIIGTAKPLEPKYGIEYLIKAMAIIKEKRPDIKLKAKIAGTGSYESEYKLLAQKQNINIDWLGFISQEQVALEYANMDIAIFPSTQDSESFSVSTVEAEASGTPVIISNTPGLLETTVKDKTSIVISKNNSEELANSIIYLYDNPQKRLEMGLAGRKYALNNFEYNNCFNKIEKMFSILSLK